MFSNVFAATAAGRLMALFGVCLAAAATGPVAAHGLVGKRFFPATLTTEDPFVADAANPADAQALVRP